MNLENVEVVRLLPEKTQKDLGVTRIEAVLLEDENGNIEHDNTAAFEFSYSDDDSFRETVKQISNKYNVDLSKIIVDWNY